jgi:hypothetical protein
MQTRHSHRLTDTSPAFRQVEANIVEPNDYINNGVFPQTDTSLTHGQMKANIVDPSDYINNGVFPQTDTQTQL